MEKIITKGHSFAETFASLHFINKQLYYHQSTFLLVKFLKNHQEQFKKLCRDKKLTYFYLKKIKLKTALTFCKDVIKTTNCLFYFSLNLK